MDIQKILLVTPTRLEAYAVRRGIRRSSRKAWLQVCGIGMRRAAAFCKKLDPHAISILVLLGWAGGLADELQIGDAIIASHVLMQGKDTRLCEQLSVPGTIPSPMITSAKVLKTAEEKREARYTGALAVEMEAYPLADWAYQHKIAFIHARVILDVSSESLPQFRRPNNKKIQLRSALRNAKASETEKYSAGLLGWINRFRYVNAQLSVLSENVLHAVSDRDGIVTPKTPIP